MPEIAGRTSNRLEPVPAWTVLTESPLKGFALAREAGTILAWDEGDQLYLLDRRGRHQSVSRAPYRVTAGALSDDGSLIALICEGPRLLLLGPDLDRISERQAPPESSSVAIDPHGRYLAVATRLSLIHFYSRHGRPAGRVETRQALAHLCFVPDQLLLLGAAAYGMLMGFELRPVASSGKLDAEVVWHEALMSNVGRLTTSGDGGMVLASCFIHGVQRYDLRGKNEGSYHLGGTASLAVPDFAGRMIAVATTEGELAVLNPAGNVRWRTRLVRPAIALETDPLGRYLVYGHETGEIVRLDLYGADRATRDTPAETNAAARASRGSVRKPEWSAQVVPTEDQAETAVVAVLDDPPRIALIASPNRLQIFSADGRHLGQAPEIKGVGRIVRTAPGWIAAATDRQLILHDARRDTAQVLNENFNQISHLAIQPDTFGLAVVQESDRLGRLTTAGRWIWKRELKSAVEDLAIGADDFAAVTSEDGRLHLFDLAGEPAGGYQSDPAEPLHLIGAPAGSPPAVVWLSLARRAQVIRGHDRTGRVLWESPIPWEGWEFHCVNSLAVVAAPDGRAQAFDGAGHLRGQGRANEGSKDIFAAGPNGDVWRVSRQGAHLICADLSGRVQWRSIAEEPLGPIAASSSGIAVLIGRSLAWFSSLNQGSRGDRSESAQPNPHPR